MGKCFRCGTEAELTRPLGAIADEPPLGLFRCINPKCPLGPQEGD